jgi:hypothetical protein
MSYHRKRPSAHWDPSNQGVLSGPQLYALGANPLSSRPGLIMGGLAIGVGYLIWRARKK